jgi:hypothetical protein
VIVRDKSEIDDSPRVRALVSLPEQTTLFSDIVCSRLKTQRRRSWPDLAEEYLLADDYAIAAIYSSRSPAVSNAGASAPAKAAGY